MPIHLLDKAYRVAGSSPIGAGRVVVAGPQTGDCVASSAGNAANLLGVTIHSQPVVGRSVTVRKAGIAEVVAAGPIPYGAPVNATTNGRVKAISEAAGTRIACLGFAESPAVADGDIIEVYLAIHERTA